MGFTQPHAALPVIQDTSNNAKGFTSRILWYFPQPVFAKFEDTILTKEDHDLAQELREKLGNNKKVEITSYFVPLSKRLFLCLL